MISFSIGKNSDACSLLTLFGYIGMSLGPGTLPYQDIESSQPVFGNIFPFQAIRYTPLFCVTTCVIWHPNQPYCWIYLLPEVGWHPLPEGDDILHSVAQERCVQTNCRILAARRDLLVMAG